MRQASPRTVESYLVEMACLISVFHRKDINKDMTIMRRAISAFIEVIIKKGFLSS